MCFRVYLCLCVVVSSHRRMQFESYIVWDVKWRSPFASCAHNFPTRNESSLLLLMCFVAIAFPHVLAFDYVAQFEWTLIKFAVYFKKIVVPTISNAQFSFFFFIPYKPNIFRCIASLVHTVCALFGLGRLKMHLSKSHQNAIAYKHTMLTHI